MQNAQACCHCGEHDHRSWSCPELAAPIHENSFFKPPAGTQQGGDDDEAVKLIVTLLTQQVSVTQERP